MPLLENFISFLAASPAGALVAVASLIFLFLLFGYLPSKDPPGPRPWPLLGNLLQLDLNRLSQNLCQLSKKYGSVFTVYFGTSKVVVLSGYKTVKEALVDHAEEFGDRDIAPIFHDFNQGHGILFTNGDTWKELRRFVLTTLRDFGMGKKLTEERIHEECGHLIPEFEKHQGKPFETQTYLNYAASNIICSIIYGHRFDYADPMFVEMVRRVSENIRMTGSSQIQIYNMFPRLTRWLKDRQVILKNTEITISEVKGMIDLLKDTLSPEKCRGLIDCFLLRKQKDEEARKANSPFNEKNMIFSVSNLFAAGTETTATTLRWCLLLMAKYPKIQDRVQEELSSVIGNRPIQMEDRKNLPYINAVIHETQRFSSIIPMAIPHQTSRDVTFQGYFIKGGTTVFPLLTSVLFDESEWEDPYNFNPAHFLDEEGKFIQKDAFMAFSAGRRICLGEGLARMELFIFFSSLLQRFRFTPPPGVSEDDLDLTPALGFTLSPSPHRLCAVSRH